ncbi:MAG: putative radical SAM enzyme (TIGR03279 family) [Candidatus Poriferisodalaceae bacterium]|jgi:putative radical SAM enzyme (TIGR03279 family)
MTRPRVAAVAPNSAAHRAGLLAGDEIVAVDGEVPNDVIRWQLLVDEPDIELDLVRGGIEMTVTVTKGPGETLGAEIDAAIFDRVQTCDNHCEFCFIYQLPKGLRRSLYLKDDDYRLSFLYGNFTTLTRFTEADLERVITEGLSPLYVSIHATDPDVRSRMLRNRRGAYSLRWLRALLDHDVEVHGQVVVCPGINDADVLDDTLCGVLDRFPELATVAVVPLGVSAHNPEPTMRQHTVEEAARVVDIVEEWQHRFSEVLGHQMVHCADEYYLLAERDFPPAAHYGDFPMHEDGIGMARAFEVEFEGTVTEGIGPRAGFFHWVDGAPAEGYRAPRAANRSGEIDDQGLAVRSVGVSNAPPSPVAVTLRPRPNAPIAILTGEYGARVLSPLIAGLDRDDVRVVPVTNDFFGGNVAVSGLMVGVDVATALSSQPPGHRYLLPDVCLSNGVFLDGMSPDDLPHPVEIVATDGIALRHALNGPASRADTPTTSSVSLKESAS